MDLIESYREELQLIRKPWTRIWVGVHWCSPCSCLPWFRPEHLTLHRHHNLHLRHRGAGTESSHRVYRPDLVRTGRLSGHRSLYLSGIWLDLGLPWPVSSFVRRTHGGLFGVLVGFPSLRLKGPYLAIATMGFGIAVYQIFANSEAALRRPNGLDRSQSSPLLGLSKITFNLLFQLFHRPSLYSWHPTTSFPPIWAGPLLRSGITTSPRRSSG